MKPVIKKILIAITTLLALFVLILFLIAGVFEKQVGNMVIDGLNARLKTKLSVGEFDLTLVRSFPNAVIRLNDVNLPGAYPDAGTLLEAKTLSLKFGLASLLSKQYKIKSILVNDGALMVHFDKKGKAGYDVFITSEEETDASFDISLKEARMKNMELIYVDEQKSTEAFWNIEVLRIEGEFSDKRFSMTSFSEVKSAFLEFPEGRYLVNTQLAYDAKIDVDLLKGEYRFEEVEFAVDANKFGVEGMVSRANKKTDFDLQIDGKYCTIQSVIGLLPMVYQKQLNDFTSRGNFYFLGKIKGEYSADQNPRIEVDYGLENGRISSPRLDYSLKDVTFSGRFNNGKENRSTSTSVFEIPDFNGTLKNKPVRFSLIVEDIDDPEIDFNFSGDLPLAGMHKLFNVPLITDGSGSIAVDSLQLTGAYRHMINPGSIYRVNTSGKFNFDNATLKVNGVPLTVESGKIILLNNNMEVEALKINGASSELEFNGIASNFLPVLLADSLNSKKARLDFAGNLKATKLDLDEMEKLVAIPVDESKVSEVVYDSLKGAKSVKRERITKFLQGTFEVVVDEFNYSKIKGKNLTGVLDFESNLMNIKEFKTEAMNGSINLQGQMFFEEALRSEVIADFKGIDIYEFFYQFENFGQSILTANNVKGELDTRMLVHSFWDKEGYFLKDKLYVLSDATIKNGELMDFGMLESFSSFVKVKDLNHVKFTELKNQLAIIDGALYVPTMFMQSNALNLIISGKQRFDNRLRYLIKVNAGQVLWNKMKRYNPDLKPKKAKKKGFINVYIVVDGTIDNYNYVRSKKNYNNLLENLQGKFNLIRKDVASKLNVDHAIEMDDWQDDPLSPDVDDEEFDPSLDKEIDF